MTAIVTTMAPTIPGDKLVGLLITVPDAIVVGDKNSRKEYQRKYNAISIVAKDVVCSKQPSA